MPNEIKDFIQFTEEEQLLEEVTKKVKINMQKDLKRIENTQMEK